MRISLTKRAERNYRSIKEYITNEWGERVAEAFEQKTVDFLDLLEDFSEIGVVEVPEKKIRGFQLTKQTRVFYRIKGERIIILTFFDVRQNPKKKPR
ncbi:MAG: type II toxin-antitoxin system RelE/ParE family toxin [Bacteroidetes bacterium]|nr:type II toxin-antitoxin system RelE/ParE family toxin [Bacteroidota bacterium]MDA1119663.1 type II toxin-antitoxin system RelE/ParE family toxin [Bacteroidota bacterium]